MTTQQQTQTKEFNKFQELVWPIHTYELKKFLPMSFLMAFILFFYTLVRDLKDIFVQYHTNIWAGAGKADTAQLISALKIWYVLPAAFLVVIAFNFLMNKFDLKKTFYIIVASFMVFYAVFGFVLYPNLEKLIMSTEQITAMTKAAPQFFKTFLTCLGNWPTTLFYVISEIWGTMGISSLFWMFANATTMRHEVKRFFGLFSLIGNIGVISAGVTIKTALKDASVANVRMLMIALLAVAATIMGIFWYINNVVLKDPRFYDEAQIKPKKKKEKVSVLEGIKILFTNSYLLLIGMLVMGYGISINFAEIILKAHMREAFEGEQYASMQGNISIFTGVFSILVVFIGAFILRTCKWKTSAVITPLMFLILGGVFFALVLYRQFVAAEIFGMSALILATWVGIIQDALCKSIKYSLFDTTKSMAYLPLDEDTKTKGQAAVEVIGGRAGKAGASLIQQVMYGIVPNIMSHVVTIVGIFGVTVVAWTLSVFGLSKKYETAVAAKNEEELK